MTMAERESEMAARFTQEIAAQQQQLAAQQQYFEITCEQVSLANQYLLL